MVVQVSSRRVIKGPCHLPEVEALEYARKHTTIPVPKVHRVHTSSRGRLYIEMEYVKGDKLQSLWNKPGKLSDDQKRDIIAGVQDAVTQMRSLTPPKPGVVASASTREGVFDLRIGPELAGPFDSTEEFNSFLRGGILLKYSERSFGADVVESHSRHHETRFTHADLAPRNIIARDGKIAAIVDWGFAGWYPEYWEFTKARWAHPWGGLVRAPV